jgi:hypothetical protein
LYRGIGEKEDHVGRQEPAADADEENWVESHDLRERAADNRTEGPVRIAIVGIANSEICVPKPLIV